MRVLLIGATGVIGDALVRGLAAAGHELLLGVRNVNSARRRWPEHDLIHIDYSGPILSSQSAAQLIGVDALVNAVGIFREQRNQTFDAIHVKGPLALFRAAAAAGVGRILQISALGAHPQAETAYLASKGEADAALDAMSIQHTIIQPSLVFAPQGRSTRWFAMLAALPLTPLPGRGAQSIQPVHLDDLCEAIVRLLEIDPLPTRMQAVGPSPLSLRAYLAYLKRALQLPGTFVAVPMAAIRLFAPVLGLSQRSLMTTEAMQMLEAGSVGSSHDLAAVLSRQPRPAENFVGVNERSSMRMRAQLDWLIPLLRWTIALMWIVTGMVSAWVYPVSSSLALLARTGLHGAAALWALYAAAALDVALGIATLAARFRRTAYRLQFLLVLLYTVLITAFLPEYWAHPYGPILKNLPLLAAIALLHELDDADGSAAR